MISKDFVISQSVPAVVTVTVCEPAGKLFAIFVVLPATDHAKVKSDNAPSTVTIAVPSLPSQVSSVTLNEAITGSSHSSSQLTIIAKSVTLAVQLLASVTVTLYVPADKSVRFALVLPSFHR